MTLRTALPALVAAALLTACAGETPLTPPEPSSRVDVDTPGLRAAKQRAGVADCPVATGPGSELPALTLACLGGGPSVTLQDVSGPAVLSLWATWCTSCPDELPLYQRLAEQSAGRLQVLGIDYQDLQPGAALTLLDDTGAAFPQLADPGGELAEHYRVRGLPGVLLVDEAGRVTLRLQLIESYDELVRLVEDHTGVAVAPG